YRVVGNVDDERKQAVKDGLAASGGKDQFMGMTDYTKEKIQKLEYKKNESVLEIISFANEESNRLMIELGINPIDVPDENVHILPDDVFLDRESHFFAKADNKDLEADSDTISQSIYLSAEKMRMKSATEIAVIIFHEMLHIKGHLSLEVNVKEDGREEMTSYRGGMKIKALQKDTDEGLYYTYFKGMDEALVSSQEKRMLTNLKSHKVFAEDVKWMNSDVAKKLRVDLAHQEDEPVEEIHWVSKDGKRFVLGGYEKYRGVFRYVLEQITEQFTDTYKSPNDVEKEFLKAHFTGHLLGIGKLVEKTFGKGSFRVLGRMRTESETDNFSAKEILEQLQIMRAEIKR
ncbi:MAG: hypothetical protein WCO16_03905, partial [bacterium]